jgi:hypothetical protein
MRTGRQDSHQPAASPIARARRNVEGLNSTDNASNRCPPRLLIVEPILLSWFFRHVPMMPPYVPIMPLRCGACR